MENTGNLVVLGAFAAIAFGALWKPGLAISALGLAVFLIGALPLVGVARVPGAYALALVGMGAFPAVIAGIFVMAFGRLVSSVEGILARMKAAAVAGPDADGTIARREPTFRGEALSRF